jgi:fructose-bisphosphate aldolase class II
VPVCIHLDHGANLGQVMAAIKCGFTSVMIDASSQPLEQGVPSARVGGAGALSQRLGRRTGHLGIPALTPARRRRSHYTNPDDVVVFIEATGVANRHIGTSHGIYPKDRSEAKLTCLETRCGSRPGAPRRLRQSDDEIAAAVGSASTRSAFSDIKDAFCQKAREVLKRHKSQLIRLSPCIDAMKKVAHHKIELFNAASKAAATNTPAPDCHPCLSPPTFMPNQLTVGRRHTPATRTHTTMSEKSPSASATTLTRIVNSAVFEDLICRHDILSPDGHQ